MTLLPHLRTGHAGWAALTALTLVTRAATAQDYPTSPPAPMPVTPAPFPPFQEATLPNGVRLLVVENRKQPIVSLSLSFDAGGIADPVGKEGLADMVAGLLTKGAGDRTAEQISEAIEGAGGSLNAGAGSDFLTINATVLTPSLPLAFDLIGDAVQRPTFPQAEVDLLRTQMLSGLQVELSQPASLAQRAMRRALYGNHPYGASNTPASLRAITRDDIVAFHRTRVRPAGALLVLAGDVNLEDARRLAAAAFRGWTGEPAPLPMADAPAVRSTPELILVHRPGSVQSNVLVGDLTFAPNDPRWYAATVANRVLGGGADSRLFLILREQKSWTYGAYSDLVRRRGTGAFLASAEVRTEVTDSALTEILTQLRRIGTQPVSEPELEAAKGALVGSYPLSIETAEQVAGAVANARLYGLAADYVQTYRVRLSAITADQAQVAARTIIRPDQAVIVVVGDGQKIYDRVKDIAPVRIVDADGLPLTPADLNPAAAMLDLDLTQLVARHDSFAVNAQGMQLGYQVGTLERTSDGFRYVEHTSIGGFVDQTTTLTLDAGARMRRVQQAGTVQGARATIDVEFSNGRARGSARSPNPDGTMNQVTIDTTVAPGTVDDNAVQALLPALKWADGAKWAFAVMSSASGEVSTWSLAVAATETVTVGGVEVECYRAELTGPPQNTTFWVTTAAPHRLMKIAIAGAPVEIVRVK